jgi:hypothetical protein
MVRNAPFGLGCRNQGTESNLILQPPPNGSQLPRATKILESQFESLQPKPTFEQRPPVTTASIFWSRGWSLFTRLTLQRRKPLIDKVEGQFLLIFLLVILHWLVSHPK